MDRVLSPGHRRTYQCCQWRLVDNEPDGKCTGLVLPAGEWRPFVRFRAWPTLRIAVSPRSRFPAQLLFLTHDHGFIRYLFLHLRTNCFFNWLDGAGRSTTTACQLISSYLLLLLLAKANARELWRWREEKC